MMRKNAEGSNGDGVVSRSARSSFRALSNCLRVISSGASTVARSAVGAASPAEHLHDQVLWSGFDKLEKEDGDVRRVLLLAFQSGFQVWDVEDKGNVHVIVSSHDGQAFFMQMLPNPLSSTDHFSHTRPLLAVCADTSWEQTDNPASQTPRNVYFYSFKSQGYVHTLKFRSIIYTVRCSSRIVAVLQASQIHCFDATTLVKDYTVATNSIAFSSLGVGYGPLAVGPRWIAYSGTRIPTSSSAIFSPELVSLSSSPTVRQFAKESSLQLATGIVNLGDKGYKSLTRYCAEVLPNPYIPGFKGIRALNDNVPDVDSVGMVIIKDIMSKGVIAQFKAHKSPIAALCFNPSGMLLVTASIQGHNINVFRMMPRISTSNDATTTSFVHLFRLQRGFTNAVIQDISFSNDSNLIMVSSSRGTSHLFEINPVGEVDSPIPLSAINRIRSGNSSGWIGTMSGAAAAAAGMVGGSLPGAIASTFCYADEQANNNYYYTCASDISSKRNLLVFAPSGCMTQYAIRPNPGGVGQETAVVTRFDYESGLETEGKLAVEPIQRWPIIQNQCRREVQDQHSDIYGGGTSSDSKSKVFPEVVRNQSVEEAWRVTKKGKARVEDKHHLYIREAELRMYQLTQLPLWARRKFRFQEIVLNLDEKNSSEGGEMELEGIQTRTIEARTRDLVPVFGNLYSPKSEEVIRESLPMLRNTTQGDLVAPLEGHETKTDLEAVHSKEEGSRSEEGTGSKTVNKEKGIAEDNNEDIEED